MTNIVVYFTDRFYENLHIVLIANKIKAAAYESSIIRFMQSVLFTVSRQSSSRDKALTVWN